MLTFEVIRWLQARGQHTENITHDMMILATFNNRVSIVFWRWLMVIFQ